LKERKEWKCKESKSKVLCGNAVNYVPVTVIWLQVRRYIVWTKETVNEYGNLIGNSTGKLLFGSRCVDDKLTTAPPPQPHPPIEEKFEKTDIHNGRNQDYKNYDQKQQHTHTHARTPRTHRNSTLQLHCIYTENCKPSGIPNAQKQIVIVKVHRHA
jgi:hypothetical protein